MESVREHLDYFTENDVIKRYAEKRDIPIDEIEDLYNCFRKWIIFKLNDTSLSPKSGFIFPKFCSFLHKHLEIADLKKSDKNYKYKRVEEQLKRYLNGHQGVKIK